MRLQLDIDLFRDILIEVEEAPSTENTIVITSASYGHAKNSKISKHLYCLGEEGILRIEAGHKKYGETIYHAKNHITSKGREFLDKIRSEEQWNIVKEEARKAGTTSLYGLVEIAKQMSCISEDISKSPTIFIVHGHDREAKLDVARAINQLGLEEKILDKRISTGSSIFEKLITHTGNETHFGVVIYTACDIGGKNVDALRPRARQNVVFEHGLLVGMLGKEKVFILVKDDDIERPSDVLGLERIKMDEDGAWKTKLALAMQQAGCPVDLNRFAKD